MIDNSEDKLIILFLYFQNAIIYRFKSIDMNIFFQN